jgi:hypothetical protein
VKILSRYPFSDKPSTVSFQQAVEEVKPFQIVVWVGIATREGISRMFPAFLDTGHNETFSISEEKLRAWTGIDYRRLRLLPGVRIGKQLLPRCDADMVIYRNVPRTNAVSTIPPFRLSTPSGIIIQHPDTATRLPILGMRGLVENELKLVIDGKRKELTLKSGLW